GSADASAPSTGRYRLLTRRESCCQPEPLSPGGPPHSLSQALHHGTRENALGGTLHAYVRVKDCVARRAGTPRAFRLESLALVRRSPPAREQRSVPTPPTPRSSRVRSRTA